MEIVQPALTKASLSVWTFGLPTSISSEIQDGEGVKKSREDPYLMSGQYASHFLRGLQESDNQDT
jgi:hypothetical protein